MLNTVVNCTRDHLIFRNCAKLSRILRLLYLKENLKNKFNVVYFYSVSFHKITPFILFQNVLYCRQKHVMRSSRTFIHVFILVAILYCFLLTCLRRGLYLTRSSFGKTSTNNPITNSLPFLVEGGEIRLSGFVYPTKLEQALVVLNVLLIEGNGAQQKYERTETKELIAIQNLQNQINNICNRMTLRRTV